MGRTNPETSFEALTFSLTHLIVTGNVALEDEVENAVAIADAMALKCIIGLILVVIKNNNGNTKNKWIDKPRAIVIIYLPTE